MKTDNAEGTQKTGTAAKCLCDDWGYEVIKLQSEVQGDNYMPGLHNGIHSDNTLVSELGWQAVERTSMGPGTGPVE